MSIVVSVVDSFSEEASEWNKSSWLEFDQESHNENSDNSDWDRQELRLVARINDKIVGTLYGHGMAGVMRISELIVAKDERRKGVGEKLMEEAEQQCIAKGFHKADLHTSKDLPAKAFYEKLGYSIDATLENHYLGDTYVLMSKLLS